VNYQLHDLNLKIILELGYATFGMIAMGTSSKCVIPMNFEYFYTMLGSKVAQTIEHRYSSW